MSEHDEVFADEVELYSERAAESPVWLMALLGGVGSALAILLIQVLAQQIRQPLLLAPFGASCVLLFLAPQSEFAQPRNLVLGYAIGTAVGFGAAWLFPGEWWAVAVAVGLAIALMRLTHTVHPPAGANPIVILLATPGIKLLLPLCCGVSLLLLSAWGFSRLSRGPAWPLRWF